MSKIVKRLKKFSKALKKGKLSKYKTTHVSVDGSDEKNRLATDHVLAYLNAKAFIAKNCERDKDGNPISSKGSKGE